MSKASKPSAPVTDRAATPAAMSRRTAAAVRDTKRMLGKTARKVREAGRTMSAPWRAAADSAADLVVSAAAVLECGKAPATPGLVLPAVTGWQAADDALGVLADALADFARPAASSPEGKAIMGAALSVGQVAMSLRFAMQGAERGEPERKTGDTVALLYGRWLAARGASQIKGETRDSEGEPYDDSDNDAAWQAARQAFTVAAAERWEVAHKVEMLRWLMAGGDIDRHEKEAAFASIVADLEG